MGAVALHRINDESGAKGAARGHDFPRAIVKNLCALGDVDTALLGRPGKPAHQFCRVYARTGRVKDGTESVRGAQGVLWFSPLELVNPHECGVGEVRSGTVALDLTAHQSGGSPLDEVAVNPQFVTPAPHRRHRVDHGGAQCRGVGEPVAGNE